MMKKNILLVLLAAVSLSACNEKKDKNADRAADMNETIEALTRENDQLRAEQDELLATINDIEDGFREINEAQGRLTIDRRGEGADTGERIREDMRYIQQTMQQNRELIERLRNRLQESGNQSEQLRHTVENLVAQMEQKNAEIEQLRAELEQKNIRIDELDEQVASLDEDLANLRQQNMEQDQTINRQERQLNAAWYVIGSKRELKDHNILHNGQVLQQGFDDAYFTEVDIRQLDAINLHSRKAEVLTTHPAGSYSLDKGADNILTLRILDYQQFWSTSKYLVVQTK